MGIVEDKHEISRENFIKWGRLGGSKGGRASTPAKRRSARINGRKGGRPKKISIG